MQGDKMNSRDCLYKTLYRQILSSLVGHTEDEKVHWRIEFAKQNVSSGHGQSAKDDLINLMNTDNSVYGEVAGLSAEIGLLVFGALEVQSRGSKLPVGQFKITRELLKDALGIYDSSYGITPEWFLDSWNLSCEKFMEITGKDKVDFKSQFISAYDLAKEKCGIMIPSENPGDYLIKTLFRQRIPKSLLKIEYEYLKTDREELEMELESGNVSDYTLVPVSRIGARNIPVSGMRRSRDPLERLMDNAVEIGELTELPIAETIGSGKYSFPNTHQYGEFFHDELREKITKGMNQFLKMFEEYHRQNIESFGGEDGLYGDDVVVYGENGCLFGDRVGEGHIILNSDIVGWTGGGRMDDNTWYTPIDFMKKLNVLFYDDYIDVNKLDNGWLSSAVDEYSTKRLEFFVDLLETDNGNINERPRYRPGYQGEELQKLMEISKLGHLLGNKKIYLFGAS